MTFSAAEWEVGIASIDFTPELASMSTIPTARLR
jgi:hypothetical protein